MYSESSVGALIIDKPEGITSHDVVSRIRRVAGTRRVGHAGTLDPFATGVLVVCIERATRLVQFLVGFDKEYIATVRLGFATDTQDLTGKQITPLRTSNELSLEDLQKALDEFTGEQMQMPPMYSAKKVEGERLYKAARAGREVAREPAKVIVHWIGLIEDNEPILTWDENGTCDFQMRVRCSSGTYVRTLANDIGERLEVGAHLAALRRTAVGHFRIDEAKTLNELESMSRDEVRNVLIRPADLLSHLRTIRMEDRDQVKRVSNGRAFQISQLEAEALQNDMMPVKLCDREGELVAVGDYDSINQEVKPRVVLDV